MKLRLFLKLKNSKLATIEKTLLLAVLTLGVLAVAQGTGSWTHMSYFDNRTSVWMVKITSTVTKPMTCTVSWTGITTGSTYYGSQIGVTVSRSFALQVPAYQKGAAIVAQSGIKDIANFSETTVCN
jgi:hypothetical protein